MFIQYGLFIIIPIVVICTFFVLKGLYVYEKSAVTIIDQSGCFAIIYVDKTNGINYKKGGYITIETTNSNKKFKIMCIQEEKNNYKLTVQSRHIDSTDNSICKGFVITDTIPIYELIIRNSFKL